MLGCRKINFKFLKFLTLAALITVFVYGWYEYREFTSVPTERLTAGSYYPEMAPDSHHYYLQLPIDHNDSSKGILQTFTFLALISSQAKTWFSGFLITSRKQLE